MNKSKPDLKQIKQQIQKAGSVAPGKPEYKVPDKVNPIDETLLRPRPLVDKKLNTLVAWIVFAGVLIVYMLTQARSLSFWDSGEYATCISILGVPHPPGNPLYIIFGRAMVTLFGGFIPHGIIAAFISALTSAFAVMFTYLITVQLTSMFKIKYWEAIFAGVIAALFTAFSFTFWMNAVEAEVYSGLVFFVNLVIWVTLYWVQRSRDFHHQNYLLLILFLFFLGFCVHQTALQIAPAILMIALYPLFIQGSKKEFFWYKFFGYGAALIVTYLIFGAIGKGLKIDAMDQMGFGLMVVILMIVELHDIIDKRVWFLGFGLILLGLSAHLYLPIRAADRPFINLADPSTSQRFDDYIQRRQYKSEEDQETSMFKRRGKLIQHQLGYHFLRYFGWQWFKADAVNRLLKIPIEVVKVFGGLIVAFLGLFGAVFHARKNKHSFFYFLAIIICTTVLMVWVMNLSDKEVRDRDYFFVVGYNMWAIWMGIGALGVISLFKEKVLRIGLVAILTFLPLLNMAAQYFEHDRSREFVALDYGVNFLNSMEENAIIFTNGDNDTYPLWYTQAVHDPYATEYKNHPIRDIYPTKDSQSAIARATAYKNTQLKGIRQDVTVANLSLLNTGWYMRQLRDKEGVVLNMTEEEINSLDDKRGKFQEYLWQDSIEYQAGDPQGQNKFTIDYRKNYENRDTDGGFYPQRGSDFAVLQIVKENYGKRPIYFAVTCESNVGFDSYLRNEGLVSRVVATPDPNGSQIDIDRLLTNIDKVYKYRSLDDKRVYKDDNMIRLVMNYGSGYTRAAIHFAKQKDFAKADAYAAKARKFIDSDLRMTEYFIRYYTAKGEWTKLDKFIEDNILPHTDAVKIYNSYVLNIIAQDYPAYFTKYMQKLLLRYPNEIDYSSLAYYYAEKYKLRNQVEAMFDSLQGKLGYTWEDMYQYLYGASGQAPSRDSL